MTLTGDVNYDALFMPELDEARLREIYQAARLFYVEGFSKTEIAHKLNVSNTQVARYIDEAKERGFVSITLNPPRIESVELKLRAEFSCLKEVYVIPAAGDDDGQLRKLGEAGARYLDTAIEDVAQHVTGRRVRVSLSGGNTLYELVTALDEKRRNIEIYPAALIGRGPYLPQHIDPIVLMTDLSRKSRCDPNTAYYVTVPPISSRSRPGDVVKQNEAMKRTQPKVREVWDRMQTFDILIASVGCFKTQKQRTLLELLADVGITQESLEKDGIVGDIAYSMLDADGNAKHPRQAKGELFLTIGVECLKKMVPEYPDRRVALIAGKGKEQALAAALRGGACNVLITDDLTAEHVLEMASGR